MKICICDDDLSIHNEIKSFIKPFILTETQIKFTDVTSGEEILEYYSKGNIFDIVFLDIEMNKVSGIQAAEEIRRIAPDSIIIFVSSHPNYVFGTFSIEPLHFIVKPILKSEFENVFRRAISKYKSIHSTIALKWQYERYVIRISDIKYIEGYKRHITVYTNDEKYESLGKIPDMLNLLESHGFLQVHQGFIVNMDYIKRFDPTEVVLYDNTKVMISVRKRTEALKVFDEYIKKWKW